ncbi:HAD family hydrolase [Flavilitoribacter nigricans]|uniref:Phosphoprotein phosphatase n=1 Tax=Flavilitoribacter nigricans (strain ATCC 23147 / DSM 23189 / NBRC 102662 / NCIMB 1420 / SS-2) TaxID=1122177 RepID=A0A2D0N7F1_FLAN2|nr:HAD family hydrolase [Flavilitoribacter nigricans]PHN04310.1 phosphoprotein phosphatase [Flavilitoribacter nigricans DSM 23189 = NBRC 102662]
MTIKNEHKTLLILDLDETLIYATSETLERPADFTIAHYQVYKRPYLDAFLQQIREHFLIAIWSSASDDYVEAITGEILPANIEPEFIWGRSRGTFSRRPRIDEYGYYVDLYSGHYRLTKPLKKVKRLGYDLRRILIVDDSPHKVEQNYGNAVYPTAYTGQPGDKELKFLAPYLLSLKDEPEVRRIEKRGWRRKIELSNGADQG